MFSYSAFISYFECRLCCRKFFSNCIHEYCYYYDSCLCAHVQSELCMVCWIVPHFWSCTHVYCLIIRSYSDATPSLHRHFHQARKHLLSLYTLIHYFMIIYFPNIASLSLLVSLYHSHCTHHAWEALVLSLPCIARPWCVVF